MANKKPYLQYLDDVNDSVLIFANIPTGKTAKQAHFHLKDMLADKNIKVIGPFAETEDEHKTVLIHMAALSSNTVVLHLCLNDEHVGDRSIIQKHAIEIAQSIDAHIYRGSKVVIFMQKKFTAKTHIEKRWSYLRNSLGFEDNLREALCRVVNILGMGEAEYATFMGENEREEIVFPRSGASVLTT